MKEKGFTLIELLAVIVILAIISLIAVPLALDVINNVKEDARKRSIENVIRTAKIYNAETQLTDKDMLMDRSVYDEVIKIIDGEKPTDGNFYVNKNGETAFALQYGEWCYTKAYTDKTYTKTKTNECIVPIDYMTAYKYNNTHASHSFLSNTHGITRESVEKVITLPTNEVPNEIKELEQYKDISAKKNGKIMAWYVDEDNNGLYEFYIGQEGGVKANKDSAAYLFRNLTNATEIDLTYFDTSNATAMNSMFSQCNNLENLVLGTGFKTSKTTNMNSMFWDCSKLTSLDLKNWDTSEVTNLGSMFANCDGLTSLDLSNWNTSSLEYMSGMFGLCGSLTELDLSNFDTSKVEDMNSIFRYCSKLEILYLNNFDISNVTNFSLMFDGCRVLNKVYVKKAWTIPEEANVSGMFSSYGSGIKDISEFEVIGS